MLMIYFVFLKISHRLIILEHFLIPDINMSFSKELEKDEKLSFVDILITKSESRFITSIYRKPTFSGIHLNFKGYIPDVYKFGLVNSLLFRTYKICSNWQIIHKEIKTLKGIWLKNGYPLKVINNCIKKFLDRLYINKDVVSAVPKKEFNIILPFLGQQSIYIKTKFKKFFSSAFPI